MLATLSFDEQLTITIIDKAVIGLLLAIAAWALNRGLEAFRAQQTKAIESLKNELSRRTADLGAFRNLARQIGAKTNSALHSMCWLCWFARVAPAQFSVARITQYDQEMHATLAELAGLETEFFVIDPDAAVEISKVVRQIEELDADVATACVQFATNPNQCCHDLGQAHTKIESCYRAMPQRIAQIARDRLNAIENIRQ